jgi:hypothetical protein
LPCGAAHSGRGAAGRSSARVLRGRPMGDELRNAYDDAWRASAYATLESPGTYALPFSDLPHRAARRDETQDGETVYRDLSAIRGADRSALGEEGACGCEEPFGPCPRSDLHAWPRFSAGTAPRVEPTEYSEVVIRRAWERHADPAQGRWGLAWR